MVKFHLVVGVYIKILSLLCKVLCLLLELQIQLKTLVKRMTESTVLTGFNISHFLSLPPLVIWLVDIASHLDSHEGVQNRPSQFKFFKEGKTLLLSPQGLDCLQLQIIHMPKWPPFDWIVIKVFWTGLPKMHHFARQPSRKGRHPIAQYLLFFASSEWPQGHWMLRAPLPSPCLGWHRHLMLPFCLGVSHVHGVPMHTKWNLIFSC